MADTEEPLKLNEVQLYAFQLAAVLRVWSMLEANLDLLISHIYRYHDGRSINSETPHTLKMKLGFFADAHKKIPALQHARRNAAEIVRLFRQQKDLRHLLVHGAAMKWEKGGTVHFLVSRVDFERVHHSVRVVGPKDWERAGKAHAQLTVALQIHMWLMMPEDLLTEYEALLDQGHEAVREFVVKEAAALPASKQVRDLLHEVMTDPLIKD